MSRQAHRRLIALISRMVPRRFRSDWKQEWEAELHHRELRSGQRGLLRRSLGSFWDALAMQPRRLEEEISQDLRYGLRMLIRSPGFALVAVLSLAIGIGANTAVFSVIDALMLRRLPVKNPSELVQLREVFAQGYNDSFSYPLYERFLTANHDFTGIAATGGLISMRMAVGAGDLEPVRAEVVSGNYFSLLGVDASPGRILTTDDDLAGDPHAVVVLSFGFWQRRFAGDPQVIGTTIQLNKTPLTIIGVTDREFTGIVVGKRTDLWLPISLYAGMSPENNSLSNRGNAWLQTLARLAPNANRTRARAEMESVSQQMRVEMAAARAAQGKPVVSGSLVQPGMTLAPLGGVSADLREKFQRPVLILEIVVVLVLLIACANVATLLLARTSVRQRETAIRLAIGGSRFRLVRQYLTESVALAVLGALAGLVVAYLGTRSLLNYLPSGMSLDIGPDAHVLGFTLAISIVSSLLFGVVPALQTAGIDVNPTLKDQRSDGRNVSRSRMNRLFVILQVALSFVLLVGAGLFVNTLRNLKSLELGFDPGNLLVFSIDAPDIKPIQRLDLYRQLLPSLEALPGVDSATLSSFGLLSNSNYSEIVQVDGFVSRRPGDTSCSAIFVGPNFFKTLGTSLLAGDSFAAESVPAGDVIPVVVNQTMAHSFFPNENPIGKRFKTSRFQAEIVGVAVDSKYRDLREAPRRTFYLPLFQANALSMQIGSSAATFDVRVKADSVGVGALVRQTVQQFDSRLRVKTIQTMDEVVDATLIPERTIAEFAGTFSVIAMLLACFGLYGVISYLVARRTREMGIRVALGADRYQVVGLVMRETIWMVMTGVVIGLVAAFATTRFVATMLFGLTPNDPWTIAGALLLIVGLTFIAGYLPARRAGRTDPLVALKSE